MFTSGLFTGNPVEVPLRIDRCFHVYSRAGCNSSSRNDLRLLDAEPDAPGRVPCGEFPGCYVNPLA